MTDITYDRYLELDAILGAQHPQSDLHDELLFIVIHQTKELWLKQTIAELTQALEMVRGDRLVEAYKGLARVSRIQAVMTLSWDVLTTMTPSDYTRFRHVLGTSSGFQSDQFRQLEFVLGMKSSKAMERFTPGSRARAAGAAAAGDAAACCAAGAPVVPEVYMMVDSSSPLRTGWPCNGFVFATIASHDV